MRACLSFPACCICKVQTVCQYRKPGSGTAWEGVNASSWKPPARSAPASICSFREESNRDRNISTWTVPVAEDSSGITGVRLRSLPLDLELLQTWRFNEGGRRRGGRRGIYLQAVGTRFWTRVFGSPRITQDFKRT